MSRRLMRLTELSVSQQEQWYALKVPRLQLKWQRKFHWKFLRQVRKRITTLRQELRQLPEVTHSHSR